MPVTDGRSLAKNCVAVGKLPYSGTVAGAPNVDPSNERAVNVPSLQPAYTVPSTRNAPRASPHASDVVTAAVASGAPEPVQNCRRASSPNPVSVPPVAVGEPSRYTSSGSTPVVPGGPSRRRRAA